MAGMQQPDTAYQTQQQMSEKSQLPMPDHRHDNTQRSHFGRKWVFGMFDCFSPCSTCCLGWWCPCFTFGKTYAREHGEGETSGCNVMCCLWYLTLNAGFHSCLQCVIRGQQREHHGIDGNTCGDFCWPLWCACCSLIQEEKESVVRMTGMDPKTKVAYQPINQGMQYPA